MPQNSKPASQTPETSLPQNKGVVEGYHSQIHETNYKPLAVPEPRTACHSCGDKVSNEQKHLAGSAIKKPISHSSRHTRTAGMR